MNREEQHALAVQAMPDRVSAEVHGWLARMTQEDFAELRDIAEGVGARSRNGKFVAVLLYQTIAGEQMRRATQPENNTKPTTPDPSIKLGERQYHAWYSRQQEAAMRRSSGHRIDASGQLVRRTYHQSFFVRPDGVRVPYTTISKKTHHGCGYDDMVYVGIVNT